MMSKIGKLTGLPMWTKLDNGGLVSVIEFPDSGTNPIILYRTELRTMSFNVPSVEIGMQIYDLVVNGRFNLAWELVTEPHILSRSKR